MAKFAFEGTEQYIRMLQKVQQASRGTIKRAVYKGAGTFSDAVRARLEATPSVPDAYGVKAWRMEIPGRLTHSQKQGLLDGLGTARMEDADGYISTKVGFDGYNAVKTKKFPKGQPNALIARALENGSSAMMKQPFIRPVLKEYADKVVQEMSDVIDEDIEKLTGGK